jgi:transcriptional regulator with XRE-family HTH domain
MTGPKTDTESFGALLRHFRLSAGLSQEALAERAGLSAPAIAALERGRRTTPRSSTLGLLADALALDERSRAVLVAAATDIPASAKADLRAITGTTEAPRRIEPAHAPALIGREREDAASLPGSDVPPTSGRRAAIPARRRRDPLRLPEPFEKLH